MYLSQIVKFLIGTYCHFVNDLCQRAYFENCDQTIEN